MTWWFALCDRQALQKVFFKQEDYTSMLRLYNAHQHEGVAQVACRWMRQNTDIWKKWKPEGQTLHLERTLYIGGIFPVTGPHYKDRGMVTGEFSPS